MNATSTQERAAIDAAMLELLFAHDPYIDWRDADGLIEGAVWIDDKHPDEITATKRFAGKNVKRMFNRRTFACYSDALRWALDRSLA